MTTAALSSETFLQAHFTKVMEICGIKKYPEVFTDLKIVFKPNERVRAIFAERNRRLKIEINGRPTRQAFQGILPMLSNSIPDQCTFMAIDLRHDEIAKIYSEQHLLWDEK